MNWGHKLVLVFVVFAGGISYLVYRSMHIDTELVNTEYYKDELRYQEVIDGTNRANALSSRIRISQQDAMIVVQLPSEMKNQKVSGSIWFYCAAEKKKDRRMIIELNPDGLQQINKKIFLPGNYMVKFDWNSNNKHYHSEEPLTIL